MSFDVKTMSEDVQDTIRQIAYLMWESAGRQHGMAMEYWLAAEKDVLSTMQAAADVIAPRATSAKAKPAARRKAPGAAAAKT